jgi:hypothetical protein
VVLAYAMNGAPLAPQHRSPVRLVTPVTAVPVSADGGGTVQRVEVHCLP